MPAAKTTGFILNFEYEDGKETKNAVRFQEVPDSDDTPIVVGTLYMKKTAYRKLNEPKKLKLSIDVA